MRGGQRSGRHLLDLQMKRGAIWDGALAVEKATGRGDGETSCPWMSGGSSSTLWMVRFSSVGIMASQGTPMGGS